MFGGLVSDSAAASRIDPRAERINNTVRTPRRVRARMVGVPIRRGSPIMAKSPKTRFAPGVPRSCVY